MGLTLEKNHRGGGGGAFGPLNGINPCAAQPGVKGARYQGKQEGGGRVSWGCAGVRGGDIHMGEGFAKG